MPDLYLDHLAPTETLQLLADAAPKIAGEHLATVRLLVSHSVFGTNIVVMLPHDQRKRLKPLVDAYRQLKEAVPTQAEPTGMDRTLDFQAGMVWLLLNSPRDPDPATPHPAEFMIVERTADLTRLASLFNNLQFFVTHTRLAAAQNGRDPIYLFHGLDDPHRRSALSSLAATDLVAAAHILPCFTDGPYRVFLPPDAHPGQQALSHFCRLFAAVFGTDKTREPLAAVVPPRDGDALFTVFNLQALTFVSQLDVSPGLFQQADLQVYDLRASQTAMTQLQQAIAQTEPYVGYRLELRQVRQHEAVEIERIRLLEQQADLEHRLAYLESVAQARPLLMRFTQAQLPALADVLRSFPMDVLREGMFQYGFQATTAHPAGLHFLFIEQQEAVMTELDPLLLWEYLDAGSPMKFWLDPFWSNHYFEHGNQALIFVPQGTALFPPMHNWAVRDMDAYVRRALERWFPNRTSRLKIPDLPLYIFEGGREVHISVLDRTSFVPLHTRLGWLNDNIMLMDALDVADFIQQMSTQARRQTLAKRLLAQTEALETQFDAAANAIETRLKNRTDELTTAITTDVQRVIDETREAAKDIGDLQQRLEQLKEEHTRIGGFFNRMIEQILEAKEKEQQIEKIIASVEREIEPLLVNSLRVRTNIKQRVEAELAELRQVRADLERKLSNL